MNGPGIVMYTDDELLPLSALQHLQFCERQCALIHVEQLWVENRFTAEGRILHDHVDSGGRESRKKIRVEFSVPLRSLSLGLIGKADVVEFHKEKIADGKSIWRPFPVEYKRGKPKKNNCDRIQICAQALCLEEMTGCDVHEGALFYGKTRRRKDVAFDQNLRQETMETAVRLHDLVKERKTPLPQFTAKCRHCSFIDLCLPEKVGGQRSARQYLNKLIGDI